MKKKQLLTIILYAILLVMIVLLLINLINPEPAEMPTINTEPFITLANEEAPCRDVRNDLYLIENSMVFWAVEGACFDASYSYTLYGSDPSIVLCKSYDSITGVVYECDEGFQEMFGTIMNNLDKNDLGLETVKKIK